MNRSMVTTGYSVREAGSALIIGLIFLLILTIIGVTAMRSTTLQERMAGNTRDINLAFQAAEAALRAGEAVVRNSGSGPYDGTVDGLYGAPQTGAVPRWEDSGILWSDVTGQVAGVAQDPRYIIEKLPEFIDPTGEISSDGVPETVTLYRITAVGYGGNNSTQVLLQTTHRPR